MNAYETRLLERVERIEADVAALRAHLASGGGDGDPARAEEVEAFADETFKSRDA